MVGVWQGRGRVGLSGHSAECPSQPPARGVGPFMGGDSRQAVFPRRSRAAGWACFPWRTENIGLRIPHSRFATCCSALAV